MQSIHFSQKSYTPVMARKWLNNNNIQPIEAPKIEDGYLVYRIADPVRGRKYIIKDLKTIRIISEV